MSDIRRILGMVPPPRGPVAAGTPEGFERVEAYLGLSLPEDYKTLINTYGDGRWQQFWFLLNPFSTKVHLNLVRQAPREDASGGSVLSAERYIRDRQPYRHEIWPERGGIFPWAITDNGGRFFWLTDGSPEGWPTIYYASREPDYRELTMPTGEIVGGLLSGELPLFEEEFGGETPPPTFDPLTEPHS